MNVTTTEQNGNKICLVQDNGLIITDVQSALDFIMTVHYEYGAARIALNKEAVHEDFFKLSSGLAGEILQKFINYRTKFAIYGDYSSYQSKPLRDFIYESNNGNDIFFVDTKEAAIEKLANAKS